MRMRRGVLCAGVRGWRPCPAPQPDHTGEWSAPAGWGGGGREGEFSGRDLIGWVPGLVCARHHPPWSTVHTDTNSAHLRDSINFAQPFSFHQKSEILFTSDGYHGKFDLRKMKCSHVVFHSWGGKINLKQRTFWVSEEAGGKYYFNPGLISEVFL